MKVPEAELSPGLKVGEPVGTSPPCPSSYNTRRSWQPPGGEWPMCPFGLWPGGLCLAPGPLSKLCTDSSSHALTRKPHRALRQGVQGRDPREGPRAAPRTTCLALSPGSQGVQ